MTTGHQVRQEGNRKGLEQGFREGFEQGFREVLEQYRQRLQVLLLHLLRQRFGDEVNAQVERRVASASVEQLEVWTTRVLSAATLAELLAD